MRVYFWDFYFVPFINVHVLMSTTHLLLIMIHLEYNLKPESLRPPALFFLFKTAFVFKVFNFFFEKFNWNQHLHKIFILIYFSMTGYIYLNNIVLLDKEVSCGCINEVMLWKWGFDQLPSISLCCYILKLNWIYLT